MLLSHHRIRTTVDAYPARHPGSAFTPSTWHSLAGH